jgi:histone H3/H4
MVLPVQPFIRLLKKFGAKRVSRKAAEELAKIVEEKLLEISKEAVVLTKHAGRKTILAEDIRLAKKKFGLG